VSFAAQEAFLFAPSLFDWRMEFIPGVELSRRFFKEAVEPAIDRHFPRLHYAAALIGYGSEVLGYDTPMSTDHNWGPRLLLFLAPTDWDTHEEVSGRLEHVIPDTFLGWPTRIVLHDPLAADADQHGRRPARLRIELHTLGDWLGRWLGLDIEAEPSARDWLGLAEQHLLEVTQGAVYRDDGGALDQIRRRLAYFPRDVWLYKLACQWIRIGQEQAFVGRCGDIGDDLGSRIIAARLARDVMRLCFLIERRYAPYPKWFGTSFSRLGCAPQIGPLLERAVRADERRERESALVEACLLAAQLHNRLSLPGILDPMTMTFSELNRVPGAQRPEPRIAPDRDFLVMNADELADAITAQIKDREIANLAPVGGVDQFSDSTDLLEWPRLTLAAARAVIVAKQDLTRLPRG
jgi:hypothetical protein